MKIPVGICPNSKCRHDQQLQTGQRCPICGELARVFTFRELGELLKRKAKTKKVYARTKRNERRMERIKFCPQCGSTHLQLPVFYRPSIWKCLDCGYEGAVVLEGHPSTAKNQTKGKMEEGQSS